MRINKTGIKKGSEGKIKYFLASPTNEIKRVMKQEEQK